MKTIAREEIEDILQRVEKPGRYAGGEWNAVKKDPGRVEVKVALAFPDLYEVGMSYLGQKILYHILNSHPHILAERVFAPWGDMERELKRERIPLFSLENRIPLERFDILGFSLLYELNYTNVLNMLDLGRIPLFSQTRTLDHPLVIAGGPAAFNPEPIADFIDLFLIGDGEEAFLEIIQSYIRLKKDSMSKVAILQELTRIEGVYVPSLYETNDAPLEAVRPKQGRPPQIKKKVLSPFPRDSFPEDIIVPHTQVIFDRVTWEVARGCPQKCRFCQATSVYFPPRVKSPSAVINGILKSLRSTGYDSVSLASLSVSDYPYLNTVIRSLMEELKKQNVSLSLSSLRPKGLTPEIAASIVSVRKTGFTLVPEAGTERLRAVINKCLEDNEIWEASANAFAEGWKRLKLYFMIGLPTETEEDLLGIVRMIEEVIRIGRRILKRAPQINCSISPFIPKPHTPFQWLPMEKKETLQEKFHFLWMRLRKFHSLRIKRDSLDRSILECVFSRGDRRLNAVLKKAWEWGARFDSWDDEFRFPIWEKAFESERVDPRTYLSALDKESELPWDHIDTGLTKNHLIEEFELAMQGKTSPPCSERDCAVCRGCSYPGWYSQRSDEKITSTGKDKLTLGSRVEAGQRYLAWYRKKDQARYLSHIDLNNAIQQGFRRAGIGISYSQGFHPKMLISHPQALPLGMEGRTEWMEFRSPYVFSEEDFLSRINPNLVKGVEFFGLSRLDENELPMHKKIKAFVYSLDLRNDRVIRAANKKYPDTGTEGGFSARIEQCVGTYLKGIEVETLETFYVDEKEKKLYLIMKNISRKGERPQDIVTSALGLENPVFFMARERFILDEIGRS